MIKTELLHLLPSVVAFSVQLFGSHAFVMFCSLDFRNKKAHVAASLEAMRH